MRIALAMLAAAWASPDPSYPSDGRGLSEVDAAVAATATAFSYSRRLFAGEQQWNDTVPFHGKRRGVGRHGRAPSPPKMTGRGRHGLGTAGRASFRGLGRAKAHGNLRDAQARRGRGRGRGRPLTDVDRHGPTGRRETQRGDPAPDPKDIGCTASTKGLRLPWAAQGGLPQLPVRRNESSAALPSYQTARPKKCAILIDRHVHKNGGSTIRDFLLEQERQHSQSAVKVPSKCRQSAVKVPSKCSQSAVKVQSKCSQSALPPPGGGSARLLRLLRARLAPPGRSLPPRVRPTNWAPSHRLRCSRQPPPSAPSRCV